MGNPCFAVGKVEATLTQKNLTNFHHHHHLTRLQRMSKITKVYT